MVDRSLPGSFVSAGPASALSNLIERPAVKNDNSYSVWNPLHGQLAGAIKTERKTLTAALTKPEKYRVPGPRGPACDQICRLGAGHQLERKQFTVP